MADADEKIIIQYIVDAATALEQAKKMREVINQNKVEIKALAEQSKMSFRDIGQGMATAINAMSKEQHVKLAEILGITNEETIQNMANANNFAAAQRQAVSNIRRAYTELNQERRADIAATSKAEQAALNADKAAMAEYEKITRQGYGVMSQAAQAYGQQVQQVKQQIVTQSQSSNQTYQQTAQGMLQAGTSANVLNSALKQLNNTGNQSKSVFGGLGSTIKQALTIGLGLNLYNLLQKVITSLREAAQSGYELAKALFQLDVGIRALRRSGIDMTTSDMMENIDKLSEKFGVFSKKSLVEGSAALINLVRDLGLTKEQIFELQDAIATLAIVNGRSMDEVQKTVALALASGYTEGLQRLGVSINRVNIAARANAMGWKGGYTALTEYQRAQATLSLVMEKTGKYADDLTKYLATQQGQIDATTATTEDLTAELGQKLIPYTLLFTELTYNLVTALSKLVDVADAIIGPFVKTYNLIFQSAREAQRETAKLREDATTTVEKIKAVLAEFQAFTKNMQKGAANLLYDLLGGSEIGRNILGITEQEYLDYLNSLKLDTENFELGAPDLGNDDLENQAEKQKDLIKNLHDDIEKENRNFTNRSAEIWRDYYNDIDKINRDVVNDIGRINRDLANDLEKIGRDLTRKLADIAMDRDRDLVKLEENLARDISKIQEDGTRKLADEEEDYARKRVKIAEDYKKKVDEANRKYADKELDAEKKHQEALRRLREEYLFDLEDALHERDARKILDLNRRYNLNKEQENRQFEQDKEDRKKEHQDELEELRRERDDRLRAADEEHQLKMDQIRRETAERIAERQRQYEQERADRLRQYEQEKADAIADAEAKKKEREIQAEEARKEREIRAQEEREERRIRAEEQIAELKISHEQRLAEIVAELAAEKDMTAAMLQNIANEYAKIYGPNGQIDQYMTYWVRLLAQRAAEAAAILSQMQNYQFHFGGNWGGNNNNNNNNRGGGRKYNNMAEGGVMYADHPTTVMFGERGLERAEFTPIGRIGKNEGKMVNSDLGISSKDGKLTVAVSLDPDLVGRIQENTLNKAADVLFEVQRRK